jgi:hypothetical protein
MRFACLLERELCSHDRTHDATFPEAEDVTSRLLDEIGAERREAAEVEAVDPDVAVLD